MHLHLLVLEKRAKLKYLGPFVEPHQTLEERVAAENQRYKEPVKMFVLFCSSDKFLKTQYNTFKIKRLSSA